MRQITKTIQMEIDQKKWTFRIKKLDAFSGASLLRMISGYVDSGSGEDLVLSVFSSLPDDVLRTLMVTCLSHAEVLLDAGYQPVMQMGEWSWSELEYDAVNALKLTLQVALWTLDGFFGESGSSSEGGRPAG
jgi:hypothetical protein